MLVKKIHEAGYEAAVLGFSLSYNSTVERTREILPKYAFGISGERKFLESMVVWLDVTAPRFFWQEADTYRVGTTKQSESTMHTLMKKRLTQQDFEYPIDSYWLKSMNEIIAFYKEEADKTRKKNIFLHIKGSLPEGFLQRRIWMISYAGLQNVYNQRKNHRLEQWQYFLESVLKELEHPEFIKQFTEDTKVK